MQTRAPLQLVASDGTDAATLTDIGESFAIVSSGIFTLEIAALPKGSSIWVGVVNEVSGAVLG